MAEAAEKTGVAKSTISRARAAGEFPNAQLRDGKQWSIPLTDLINSGRLDTVKTGDKADRSSASDSGAMDTQTHQELLHQLELAEQRAEMLQQQVVQAQSLIEAKNEALEGYKSALRAIEARKPDVEEPTSAQLNKEVSDQEQKEPANKSAPRVLKQLSKFFR